MFNEELRVRVVRAVIGVGVDDQCAFGMFCCKTKEFTVGIIASLTLSRQQVLDLYRQFPYTNTGRMVHRLRDGSGDSR